MDDFNNNNNDKTVILHCNTHLLGDYPSDIFFEGRKYKKTQENSISLLLSDKSCNILPNGLFEKLYNLDLIDFIDFQDLFNVKSIQKLDIMQSGPLSQLENTK